MIRKLAAFAAALLCLAGVHAQAGTITDHTDPKMRTRGMAEAPAIIDGMKLSCELADARYVGPADSQRDGKTIKGDSYEVACKSLKGYFLVRYKDGSFEAPVNCNMAEAIHEKNKAYPACSLPGNRINHYWLTPYAKARTPNCTVGDARWIDEDAKKEGEFYELSCKDGTGGIYNIPHADKADQSVGFMNCLQTEGTVLACKLSDHAAAVKTLAPMAKSARADCDLSDARYIGAKGDLNFFEAACATLPGFIMALDPQDKVAGVFGCDKAAAIGGCKFTDAATARAAAPAQATAKAAALKDAQKDAQKEAYAAALQQAQVACNFDQYARVGTDTATGRDVVEFHCPERPNGLLAMIPGKASGSGFEAFDCMAAHILKVACRFTDDATLLASLNTAAKASPQIKPDCDLAQVRYAFASKTGAIVMELACVNRRGYIAVLNPARTGFNPAVPCDVAAKSDKVPEKCTIPGNGSNTAS
jgi:hypothetical protein